MSTVLAQANKATEKQTTIPDGMVVLVANVCPVVLTIASRELVVGYVDQYPIRTVAELAARVCRHLAQSSGATALHKWVGLDVASHGTVSADGVLDVTNLHESLQS